MAKDAKKVQDIMDTMDSVKADDPDMMEKLTEIAKKVAEAQGKTLASAKTQANNFNNVDPMEDLGCEGCQ
jgi:hypothetical protein